MLLYRYRRWFQVPVVQVVCHAVGRWHACFSQRVRSIWQTWIMAEVALIAPIQFRWRQFFLCSKSFQAERLRLWAKAEVAGN